MADRSWLAAKLVGRWPGGAPLVLSPERDDPALANANDFQYHDLDATGHACPLGAHVRRSNPRDSLEPKPGSEQSREVNRRHRLLRRGRNWSTAAQDGRPAEQGIHFVCLNANLGRQYEFVQHSWINDPAFNGLYDSTDPLVGPATEAELVRGPGRAAADPAAGDSAVRPDARWRVLPAPGDPRAPLPHVPAVPATRRATSVTSQDPRQPGAAGDGFHSSLPWRLCRAVPRRSTTSGAGTGCRSRSASLC